MEGRNSAPQGEGNIRPVNTSHPYDDLQNWYYPSSPTSGDNSPDYLATDGVQRVNTISRQYEYPFTPHSGNGCVGLAQHDSPGDHRYDEFITQQLSQPLIPGHLYQAEFWVLRRPGKQYRIKLALSVTSGDPTYDASQNLLLPTPDANKVVVSGDIQDIQNWTKVTGTISIPVTESTNQWVSIGYDRSDQTFDTSLPVYNTGEGIYCAIDDVALYDLGCGNIPPIAFGNYSYNGQPYYLKKDEPNVLYNNFQAIIDIGSGPGQAATYTFEIYPAFNSITQISAYSARLSLNLCPNCTSYRYGTVVVTKTYPGGCTTSQAYEFSLGYDYQYSYAPNPTSDQLTVSAVEEEGSSNARSSASSNARASTSA
ncbi:MAG: hypothetical protein EOO61_13585, partial [Hymenobacter sp.]